VGAAAKPIGTTLQPGARLGRYELIQSVAVGGMAEIYLARVEGPQRFEKFVILKRILPHLAADHRFVDMFLEEARLAATMSHSNVVQVHDFGEDNGSYFFTMEYVHGEDARSILRACRKRGQTLRLKNALSIVINACSGLHYAHELEDGHGHSLGIVHRDVSPSNVLVTFDGQVKIADFGIAKATQRTFSTKTGTVKGKVSYMSPEQCNSEELDRRSDVFALGIVAFELTTGHKLFGGDNDLAIMRKIIDVDAPRPSSLVPEYPPELDAIIARTLQRDRNARPATALELQQALEQFCRNSAMIPSSSTLATEMVEIFGKVPHPWAGKRTPTAITLESNASDWDVESKPTTLVRSGERPAAATSIPSMPTAPTRSRRVAALALAGLVGGGAAIYALRPNGAEPQTIESQPNNSGVEVQRSMTPSAPTVPAATEPATAPPTEAPTPSVPPPAASDAPVVSATASPKTTVKPHVNKRHDVKPTKVETTKSTAIAKPVDASKPVDTSKPADTKPRDRDSPFLTK